MQTPSRSSKATSGRASRSLNLIWLLCACSLFAVTASAQTGMPGRIMSSSGVSYGGIIEFNPDASNVVNLTANTFDTSCTNDFRNKSVHPSATRDGRLLAFASNRDGTGYRIFVMSADGTGVRQLTTGAGAVIDAIGLPEGDYNPVISPDGARVAFISKRNTPANNGVNDIFVVNTDGSGGIQQVTFTQSDTGDSFPRGNIISVVWSPDGTRLAFKGTRLAADGQPTSPNMHHVLGLINANGTNETTLAIVDNPAGVTPTLDWSPDGRYITTVVLSPLRVALFDMQNNTSRAILQSGTTPGGDVVADAGSVRFSPDSQRLIYSTYNFPDPPHLVVVDLNGVQQSIVDIPAISGGAPLWWAPGAAIPVPERLELVPTSLVSRLGGTSVQMLPALFDAAGNVIARAATGWGNNGNCGYRVSHQGLVSPDAGVGGTFNSQVCATNGGKQACAAVFVNPTTNKSDEPEFFTSYQYFDFLNRTPDSSGLAFWTGNITGCGSNAGCVQAMRVNVSAAFFLSIEFQETGFLVYRFYKSAFGDLPGKPVPLRRDEFLPDTHEIGEGVIVNQGDWAARLEQNKQDFAAAFVMRPRFTAAYPSNMTAAEFVDKLNQNAGGPLDATERLQRIAELGSTPADTSKRASVLRKVAEDQTLKDAEFRKAFVLMQYFGYLRRDPDAAPDTSFDGYNFWLGKLNEFGGNYLQAEMVKAFITSVEYRQRFGQ